jgi:predicted nicotinamide N-methyase
MQTPRDFIQTHLDLIPAPSVPDIQLYRAHPRSGLSRLLGEDGVQPYWAYGWAGGTVLARYLLDHSETAKGRRVLDLGTGSGLVAIAAAKCGAASVTAVDIDAHAIAAATLNAEANGVDIIVRQTDLLDGQPPEADLILVSDLFYDKVTAERLTKFLLTCDAEILVGDPGRAYLPYDRLTLIAEYDVPDFGVGHTGKPSAVFRFLK